MSDASISVSEKQPREIGLLGSGVIGGGWAARFILNGIDVRVHGRSPGALERVQEQLAKARRAYRRLTQAPLPSEGSLTVVNSLADAVHGVDLVQESVPERLEVKQQLFAEVSRVVGPETLICSSSSGLVPSLLQAKMGRPESLLVAHPFNPVYLVPLVELCAGQRTAPEALARAGEIYRAIGMHPLVVRKEVDGFIANRLQTAAWREALWLVHDDLATVQEIDDAVRYSFGLRQAALGPFRTYFVGSGQKSFRSFLEKWGPGRKSSSKLDEIPEYSDALLDKLAEQSDAQDLLESVTISEFEQKLDDGIVAVLKGLRSLNYGAGETLSRWEEGLRDRATSRTSRSDAGTAPEIPKG
ncbi:3-hydroxyacyl-CoA dehydrogenase NAD-binding domain-containing protein [Bradyrhizobium sp. STM 3566]|uniref:3-hydroxyacyl-CoA dehydrogenase NAD-binding domain-containing protein n=1 Tax=Bradyrhizobium sp. STM 3566 TaxID=578928 RepID=UPI00388D2308